MIIFVKKSLFGVAFFFFGIVFDNKQSQSNSWLFFYLIFCILIKKNGFMV